MKVRSQLGLQIKNQTFRRWLIPERDRTNHSLSFSATTTLTDVVPKENLIFSAMKLDLYSHADTQSEEQENHLKNLAIDLQTQYNNNRISKTKTIEYFWMSMSFHEWLYIS